MAYRVRLENNVQRVRLRVRKKYTPKWEGPIELHAYKVALREAWRVKPQLDEDDLMQEFFMIFQRCYEYYPAVVDEPHFFVLYRNALRNFLINQSKKRTRRRKRNTEMDFTDPNFQPVAGMDPVADAILKMDAPPPIKRIITQLVQGQHRIRRMRRESINNYLCRVAGVNPRHVNLSVMLNDYLTGGTLDHV